MRLMHFTQRSSHETESGSSSWPCSTPSKASVKKPGDKTMVDETLMLDKLLRVTDEEDDLLQLCFLVLTEHEIAACLNQAREIAAAELRTDDAATLLTGMFVKVIIRGIRWARLERQREGSTMAPEEAVDAGVNEDKR